MKSLIAGMFTAGVKFAVESYHLTAKASIG